MALQQAHFSCSLFSFLLAISCVVFSRTLSLLASMAGPGNDPVQVFWTGRANHWEFLRLWTGFELPSSCRALPCYAANRNRNILDFM
jgi:hypothetical protein